MEHLVDLDEAALDLARRRLGTDTPSETVNAALRLALGQDAHGHDPDAALNVLAGTGFDDRDYAWR